MLRTLLLCTALFMPTLAFAAPEHGQAIYGKPKYQADFKNFDYVNPDAPKGGALRLESLGTFDSLNPFIVKGKTASNMGLIYQTLMKSSSDEPFSQYGDIAESVDVADDKKSITYKINDKAVWHDGTPITADDVAFSLQTLTVKGSPFYASYYADIDKVIVNDPKSITFTFKTDTNRELPLIMGQFPILPAHYYEDKPFDQTTLTPPLGSGPYKLTKVDAGRSLTFERVKDWWAADLPANKGQYNFDTITVDYYRDSTVSLEALFAGQYDVRDEYIAKTWATGYDTPQVRSGKIKKEEIKNELPTGMQGFMFNLRRPQFAEREVREALQNAFDFEWSNRALAHDAYKRTKSYFENSIYASSGLPSKDELKFLEPLRDQIPPEVFTKEYAPPKTDGSGDARDNLRRAMKTLDDAGWVVGTDGIRSKNGTRLEFEIIHFQPEFERWILPLTRNMRRIGVGVKFRVVDTAQYVARMNDFDYDMTISGFGQSLSPGNEQREFWGSSNADAKGSRNIIGIKNPAIDKLSEAIANATTQEDLIAATRALDRVLLWNHYVIPQYYVDSWRVAYWDKFDKPKTQAPYSLGIVNTWWAKTPAAKDDKKPKK